LPSTDGRAAILRLHVERRGIPVAGDVDLDRLARLTPGASGAELANLLNEAAIFAVRARREKLAQADFDAALERVVAGMQSRRTLNEHERRVVAFHEAGHALCAELLPGVNRVHKISIVPRGKALGYTLNLPEEDRYLKSRQELIDYMKMLLAGRVAEQITFGRVTTGAADDLKRVTGIARSMVYEYAMGTQIRSHQVPGDDYGVSEALRRTRDEEVQAIAEEAYRGAHRLLTDHRDLLDEVAERLLVNEAIEREEIVQIMRAHRERSGRTLERGEDETLGTPAEVMVSEPPEARD
jgi:cell division protease FtsH